MKIRIEYCKRWNYLPQATGLVAEMKASFPNDEIQEELVQGDGGVFEVQVDGKAIYSKAKEGRFPAYQEIPVLVMEASL